MNTKPKDQLKNCHVSVKCTKRERENIKKAAQKEGRTMSSFIMYILNDKIK